MFNILEYFSTFWGIADFDDDSMISRDDLNVMVTRLCPEGKETGLKQREIDRLLDEVSHLKASNSLLINGY